MGCFRRERFNFDGKWLCSAGPQFASFSELHYSYPAFLQLKAEDSDVAPRAEVVAALSPEAVKRLEALEVLQKGADEHLAAMLEERKALELKYHALHVTAWKQRADILTGVTDPASSTESSGITKFWLQAMSNHPAVADFIEERDEDALTALKDISWEYLPELKVS